MERQKVHNAYRPWEFCQQQDYLLRRNISVPYVTSMLRISKGITCPSCLCAHLHCGADKRSQPQLGWKQLNLQNSCVRAHVHMSVHALQEGTNEKKKRSDLCLSMSRESLRTINSQSQGGRPHLGGALGARVLCFFGLLGWQSTFSSTCHQMPNHAPQTLQGNCKELLGLTVQVSILTKPERMG